MPALFSRLDTVFIKVSNLAAAVEWYTKILGLELRWRNDKGGFAALDIDGVPITLVEEKNPELFKPFEDATFLFYGSDIESIHEKLAGQEVETGPIEMLYDVKWFWFKDPDGNMLKACYFDE